MLHKKSELSGISETIDMNKDPRGDYQKSDGKKNSRNPNRYARNDNNERIRIVQSSTIGQKSDRKITKPESGGKVIRHSSTTIPLRSDPTCHTPRFEVFESYTLVAKHNPGSILKPSSSTLTKSRSDQLFQYNQPHSIVKPHYGQNPETNQKIVRTTSSINADQNRGMLTVSKTQSKPEYSGRTKVPQKHHNQTQAAIKMQARPSSATTKPYTIGNTPIFPNYDSLNRPKSHKVSDDGHDKQLVYYSLPRKAKDPNQNGVRNYGQTKRISSHPLYIDTGSSKKPNPQPTKIDNNNSASNTLADGSEEQLINFSQTLARAATNSPPIRRRSSASLHLPNPRINARFATRSTIDEIYTQKNRNDNYEKYKKVANEILRENLALKFGDKYPFNNQLQDKPFHSSTSSLSSTSSATDQQQSISSIPPDDIPLDIPNQRADKHESFQSEELFHPQKSHETEENTEILEGTVTSDRNHLETVNNVHLSDGDNDDSDECDLNKEPHSSSPSYGTDSDGDIEQFKKKFVPLHEIERMDDDFALNNLNVELPDHQHSQSFRIENTSIGSIVEVFVFEDSLQRAKDALLIVPKKGILSVQSTEKVAKKTRRAIFDPHILLLDACLEPDCELVKELMPRISNISRSTVDGITALHNAVCSADAKLVLFLIHSGANVNASDGDGWTPLHCAACCNNKLISQILVENGASLFAVTLSDYEIPSQKCNKTNLEDTQCEEYLFWQQENLGVVNSGIVYALFEYTAQSIDELSLMPNQILKVLNTSPPGETGWFLVEDLSAMVNVPKRGFVAAAYVSCYTLTGFKCY